MDRKRTQKAWLEVSFTKPCLSVQCVRQMLRLRTKQGSLAWFLVHSESNLPETVTPNVKDKFNFRSLCSLNSKLQKGVFKDVIPSMHLKTILYFRVRNQYLALHFQNYCAGASGNLVFQLELKYKYFLTHLKITLSRKKINNLL